MYFFLLIAVIQIIQLHRTRQQWKKIGTKRLSHGHNKKRMLTVEYERNKNDKTNFYFRKTNTPRYDEHGSQKTPQIGKSPRSVRSTPRTNTSPRSMTLGDATPLYDEN